MLKLLGTFLALTMSLLLVPVHAQSLTTQLTWTCASSTSGNQSVYTCYAGTQGNAQFQVQWPSSSNLTPTASGGLISLSPSQASGFTCTASFDVPTAPTRVTANCTGTIPSSLRYTWSLTGGNATPVAPTPVTVSSATNDLAITPASTQATYIKYSVTVCDANNLSTCSTTTATAQNTISPPSGCTITSTAGASGLTVAANTQVPLNVTGCANTLAGTTTYTWTPTTVSGQSPSVSPTASTTYSVKVCNPVPGSSTTYCQSPDPSFTVNVSSGNSGVFAQCGPGFTTENFPWAASNTVDPLRNVTASSVSGAVYVLNVPQNGQYFYMQQSVGTAGTLDVAYSQTQACVFGNSQVAFTNAMPVGGAQTAFVYGSPPVAPFVGTARLSPGTWYVTVRGRTTTGGTALLEMYTY